MWDENLELNEAKMRMKGDNEHPNILGFVDDWDDATHGMNHSNQCPTCNSTIDDGEEFIELLCNCVHHVVCLEWATVVEDYVCLGCNWIVRMR